MAHNLPGEKSAWIPDLIGPIFKRDSLTLKQALDLRNADEQIHHMATFVPDEVLYGIDLSKKDFRRFQAVLMFLQISFSTLFKKYINNNNGGSLTLTAVLNSYVHIVVREIYCSDGDVLKFSTKGLLAMWKARDGEFMFDTVRRVISCATCIRSCIAALKNENEILRINIGISAGDVTFSVIGDDKARHFVIFGQPIEELKRAQKISLTNDLILSLSAWQHCTPSQYEYVIKDLYNIKVIRILDQSNAKSTHATFRSSKVYPNSDYKTIERKFMLNSIKPLYRPRRVSTINNESLNVEMSLNNDSYLKQEEITTTIATIAAINPDFGVQLRSYLMKPVIQQIEKSQSLEFLTEIRQITAISLDVIANKCPDHELILLADRCFILLHSIAAKYAGCINALSLYDKNILFCIVFGIRGSDNDDQFKINETCKNAVTCAIHMLQAVKNVAGIISAFVGVSTGMAYCGVIGHSARKHYAVIGLPIVKAEKIMDISYNKISCDHDTVLHSRLSKDQFRSRGVRSLQFEKCHIYDLDYSRIKKDVETSSLDYCYPILGRTHELECFDNILDDIGVADRNYSGLLIEGSERSGKSRLLDAFVTNVCNRQIRPIKLSLHLTYTENPYAVVYHVLLQLLDAEDFDTVEEREKALLDKLGDALAVKDFCYLNPLMRVNFPLSDIYTTDSDWRRHTKTIRIFETILKMLQTKICILLDDIQYMNYKSWQFLSSALNNPNVIIVMTMLKPNSLKNLTDAEVEICKDERLTKCTLNGLEPNLLPVFACQFLNVLGISRKLKMDLQRCQDGRIDCCETFLTSILQNNALDFITIELSQLKKHDLFFPYISLVTKLPVDLTLEEQIPPLQWKQIKHLNVCIENKEYSNIYNVGDVKEMMAEIYHKMNPYEQSLITCAATLGKVFKRYVLQNVMPNAILPHTNKAISEMIRMRILECASLQRRDFYYKDLIFCVDKKRKTFSDMHHLLSCNCHHSHEDASASLVQYAHCKMLEFKVDLFRKVIYDMQSDAEKRDHHARIVKLYIQDARKCISCGGRNFLKIPSKEIFMEKESPIESARVSLTRRRSIVENQNDKWSLARRSVLSVSAIASRRPESSDTRRISLLPMYLDDEEDEVPRMETRESFIADFPWFRKRSASIALEMMKDPLSSICLEEFSHIDYRDCQCNNIISYLFSRLHQHIENSGEMNEILDFVMEYSAGLIQTAQPLYAITLLTVATKRNEAAEKEESNLEENITNKRIILILMGDAHSALGNQAQAKNCYTEAVRLQSFPSKMNKAICYSILSRFYCIPLAPPQQSTNKISRHLAMKKLEMASCLRHLCTAFVAEDKLKVAQVAAIRSVKLGFPSADNFAEKGEIYLAAVQVLYRTKNMKLLREVERSMLAIIKVKTTWYDAEEIVMVANIYHTMYQTRALGGKLEEAVDMGIRVLKISVALHLNKLMLIIVPSLIEIMLWTKRINDAVDLMQQLFFLADSDIDLSARTWYYALSLELMLDAGIVLESYDSSYTYYKKFIAYRSKSCVMRDPQSLCRLMTCLWMYQIRMGYAVINSVECRMEEYMTDINYYNFAQIFSCCMRLECCLLILLRCVNLKNSTELLTLIQNTGKMIKCLNGISSHAAVVKPRLYLLVAYLYVIRGRKSSTRFYLHKAQKFASSQGNKMISAWIIQNKRTWIEKIYNNMAQYWLEYVESEDIVAWQYIRNFNIDTWSTILYSLSTPDAHV